MNPIDDIRDFYIRHGGSADMFDAAIQVVTLEARAEAYAEAIKVIARPAKEDK